MSDQHRRKTLSSTIQAGQRNAILSTPPAVNLRAFHALCWRLRGVRLMLQTKIGRLPSRTQMNVYAASRSKSSDPDTLSELLAALDGDA